MKIDSKYPWYILDLVLFGALNVFLLWVVAPRLENGTVVDLRIIIILGLAVFRGAHVISNEKVTKPLREPFVENKIEDGKTVEVPLKYGARGALGNLLYCPACTGIWVSMLLIYSYIMWPRQVLILAIILALSAIERMLTVLFDFLKHRSV